MTRHTEVLLAIGRHFPNGAMLPRLLRGLLALGFLDHEVEAAIFWMKEEGICTVKRIFGGHFVRVKTEEHYYQEIRADLARTFLLRILCVKCKFDINTSTEFKDFIDKNTTKVHDAASVSYNLAVLASEGCVEVFRGRLWPTSLGCNRAASMLTIPKWMSKEVST